MAEKYNCPDCNNRHSTEAWTYRTRYQLGILDIDKEDIIHMDKYDILIKGNNTFYCPSCGMENRVIDIFEYNKEINVYKIKVKRILRTLIISGGSLISLKGKDGGRISVDYNEDGSYFDVRYKDELGEAIVEPTGDLEETAEYLMLLGVDSSFTNRKIHE